MDIPFHAHFGQLAQRRRSFFSVLTERRLKRGVFGAADAFAPIPLRSQLRSLGLSFPASISCHAKAPLPPTFSSLHLLVTSEDAERNSGSGKFTR
jgi:hypothetical protein